MPWSLSITVVLLFISIASIDFKFFVLVVRFVGFAKALLIDMVPTQIFKFEFHLVIYEMDSESEGRCICSVKF